MNRNKIGILLINLGTPDATDYFSVRKYLSEFLSDKRVIDYPGFLWQPLLQGVILATRPFKSGKAYKKIWNNDLNESPLLTYTRSICDKLSDQYFGNENIKIAFAMRYGGPSIKNGMQSLINQGCSKVLLMPLYPQYSATTTATALDKVYEFLSSVPDQPEIRTLHDWHDDEQYISLLTKSVERSLAETKTQPDFILTSFHGLPERYIKNGDPYYDQCNRTSNLLRDNLGFDQSKWITTFQSRFGPEKWLTPYTDKMIEQLAKDGVKNIAIISPSFVCECIETLEEINIEAREEFLEAGGESFNYIPCLNDLDEHINFLAELINRNIKGWNKITKKDKEIVNLNPKGEKNGSREFSY